MTNGLPDYYEALANAIERLPRNDRAARGALYDRARRLLLDEAQNANPPWHLMEIVREQRALEEAILKAEARYGAQLAAPSRPKPPPPRPAPVPQKYAEEVDDDYPAEPPEEEVREPPPQAPQRMRRRPQEARSRAQGTGVPSTSWRVWAIVGGVALLVVVLAILFLRPPSPQVTTEPPAVVKANPKAETKGETKADPEIASIERELRQRELITRGNERSRAQDYEASIDAYTEAIGLGPVEAAVYNNRAFAYWSRGMTDEAIADYDEAIRLDPQNAVALTNRAVAYNFRGDYDAAIRDLDRALALRPGNPDILNSRCWGRALAGHTQAAVADCNEALRTRPDDPNTLDSRGFAYLKMGKLDRAIADYNTALKIDPKLAGALYGRGLARVRKGDKKGGEADISSARALRPEIEMIFARYGVK